MANTKRIDTKAGLRRPKKSSQTRGRKSKSLLRSSLKLTSRWVTMIALVVISVAAGYILTHGSRASPAMNDCSRSSIDIPSCGVLWGAYVPSNGLTTLESQVDRKFDIFQAYHDFSTTNSGMIPNSGDQTLINGGRILLASWQDRIYSSGAVDSWPDIAAGDYDSTVIIPQAERIKALGSTKIFLSFAPEMNDTSTHPVASYGTASDYVAAYRHIHDVFSAQGVSNVIWVWTPTGSSSSLSTEAPFYPGDNYVDWIGYDPYNFYQCFGDTTWKSAYTTFSRFYDWVEDGGLDAGAESKPFIMDEYGSHDDADDPIPNDTNWYAQIPSALSQLPRLKALSEFDSGGDTPSGVCSTTLSSAADIAGFTSAGLSPAVMGTSTSSPASAPTPTPKASPIPTPTPPPSSKTPLPTAQPSPQDHPSPSPLAGVSPPVTPVKTLVTSPGTPTVSGNITVPKGEEVTIDGKVIASGSINTSDLTNGKHIIAVKANGQTITKTINVQNALSPFEALRNAILASYDDNKVGPIALLGCCVALIAVAFFALRKLLRPGHHETKK